MTLEDMKIVIELIDHMEDFRECMGKITVNADQTWCEQECKV